MFAFLTFSLPGDSTGNNRLPGIMALGYIAAFSETLALSVVAEKALPPLVSALNEEPEDHLKSATAWTLGQVGTWNLSCGSVM